MCKITKSICKTKVKGIFCDFGRLTLNLHEMSLCLLFVCVNDIWASLSCFDVLYMMFAGVCVDVHVTACLSLPVMVCLSLCALWHFSSESIYCLCAHNKLLSLSLISPQRVYLSHSVSSFSVFTFLFLCFSICPSLLLLLLLLYSLREIPCLYLAVVGMTPHSLCYRIWTARLLSDSSHCLSACVWLCVCVCVCVCVLIWHSQRSLPDFSSLLIQPDFSFQLATLVCVLRLPQRTCVRVWCVYVSAGRKCVFCLFPIDWVESVFVCVCVFSCSWRFTFYLLAFFAGLAVLIDVSTVSESGFHS